MHAGYCKIFRKQKIQARDFESRATCQVHGSGYPARKTNEKLFIYKNEKNRRHRFRITTNHTYLRQDVYCGCFGCELESGCRIVTKMSCVNLLIAQ